MELNLSVIYAFSFLTTAISFLFATYLFFWVKKQKATNETIIRISDYIKSGANTFIRKEYTPVSYTHLDVYKRQPFTSSTASMLPTRCKSGGN